MPEVVEADAAEERGEGAGEVGRVDRSALGSGEHVPVVLPRGSCGLKFALLSFMVMLQRVEAAGGEGDAAFGGPGLGGQRDEAVRAGALKGAADGGGGGVEVEVFPAQSEEFALAESGVEGEFEQVVQPVALCGGEESAGFVGGEGFEASGPGCAGADVAGDVARDLFLADGVLQGGLEHGVDVGERQRGEHLVAALAGGAVREVKEETGLDVEITGLVGTYTDPKHIIAYTDGEVRRQFNVCFTARITGGQLEISDESTELRFVPSEEIEQLPMHHTQRLRLQHFLEQREKPYLG